MTLIVIISVFSCKHNKQRDFDSVCNGVVSSFLTTMQVLRCKSTENFGWLLEDLEYFCAQRDSEKCNGKLHEDNINNIHIQRAQSTARPQVCKEFGSHLTGIYDAFDILIPSKEKLSELLDTNNTKMKYLLALVDPVRWRQTFQEDNNKIRRTSTVDIKLQNNEKNEAYKKKLKCLLESEHFRKMKHINNHVKKSDSYSIFPNEYLKLFDIKREIIEMHLMLNDIRENFQDDETQITKLINETIRLKKEVEHLKYLENLILLLDGDLDRSDTTGMPFKCVNNYSTCLANLII